MTVSGRPQRILIAAVHRTSRVIGDGMKLPWHIPQDLKRFKALTMGQTLIMGRRTYESLVTEFGGPLPGRTHAVLTRGAVPLSPPGAGASVACYRTVEEALDAHRDEEQVFIAGGANIYEQFIDQVDRLELTLVDVPAKGDVFFPPWEHLVGTRYRRVALDAHPTFSFETFDRI